MHASLLLVKACLPPPTPESCHNWIELLGSFQASNSNVLCTSCTLIFYLIFCMEDKQREREWKTLITCWEGVGGVRMPPIPSPQLIIYYTQAVSACIETRIVSFIPYFQTCSTVQCSVEALRHYALLCVICLDCFCLWPLHILVAPCSDVELHGVDRLS